MTATFESREIHKRFPPGTGEVVVFRLDSRERQCRFSTRIAGRFGRRRVISAENRRLRFSFAEFSSRRLVRGPRAASPPVEGRTTSGLRGLSSIPDGTIVQGALWDTRTSLDNRTPQRLEISARSGRIGGAS